jgi:hypothetical protein
MGALGRFVGITADQLFNCPDCRAQIKVTEANERFIAELKSSYQTRINLLEDALEAKRTDEKLFRDILLRQTGLLVEQGKVASDPDVIRHVPISRGRNLDALERHWADREKVILERESSNDTRTGKGTQPQVGNTTVG